MNNQPFDEVGVPVTTDQLVTDIERICSPCPFQRVVVQSCQEVMGGGLSCTSKSSHALIYANLVWNIMVLVCMSEAAFFAPMQAMGVYHPILH